MNIILQSQKERAQQAHRFGIKTKKGENENMNNNPQVYGRGTFF